MPPTTTKEEAETSHINHHIAILQEPIKELLGDSVTDIHESMTQDTAKDIGTTCRNKQRKGVCAEAAHMQSKVCRRPFCYMLGNLQGQW
jgi:hypothetical protein